MSLSKLVNYGLCLTMSVSCLAFQTSTKDGGSGPSVKLNPKSSIKIVEKKSKYNSLNSDRDIVGCLGTITVAAPLMIITEAIGSIVSKNRKVDLYINSKTIAMVKKDIDVYLEESDYEDIRPDRFYDALSQESLNEITYAMLKGYGELSKERYDKKRKLLAHAFLYLFESEKESGTFKFSYNMREQREPGKEVYDRESYSFASSKKLKDALDADICGYFRYYEFDNEDEVNQDIVKEVKCLSDGNRVELALNYNNDYNVLVNGQLTTFNYEDLNVKEKDDHTRIKKKTWFKFPKLDIKAYQHTQFTSETSAASVELKYSRKDKVKYNDLVCLTTINNES